MMQTKQFNAIGNFIFAGGFTLGVRQHFNVLGHLESGNFGVETARHNFPELQFSTVPGEWQAAAEKWMGKKKLDLLYSNPPCAAWSKAGTFTWNGAQAYKDATHHTDCTLQAAELALSLRPAIWVWESVPEAWRHGHEFTRSLAQRFIEAGYAVTLFFTDLQLHGCPQARPRMHFIAHRVHLTEELLSINATATEGVLKFLLKSRIKKQTTAPLRQQLVDTLKKMTAAGKFGSVRQFMDRELGGEHLYPVRETSTGRVYRVGRPSFLVKRVKADGVSETITGGANLCHPLEPRYLSVEEQQVLGGWPLGFRFQGTVNQQYAQVGKAVQPATAEFLAKYLRRSLEEGRKVKKPYFSMLDYRPMVKGKTLVYTSLEL